MCCADANTVIDIICTYSESEKCLVAAVEVVLAANCEGVAESIFNVACILEDLNGCCYCLALGLGVIEVLGILVSILKSCCLILLAHCFECRLFLVKELLCKKLCLCFLRHSFCFLSYSS